MRPICRGKYILQDVAKALIYLHKCDLVHLVRPSFSCSLLARCSWQHSRHIVKWQSLVSLSNRLACALKATGIPAFGFNPTAMVRAGGDCGCNGPLQDIKSPNVLLKRGEKRAEAKLADVGLSQMLSKSFANSCSNGVGTFSWAATELLLGSHPVLFVECS